MAAAAVVPANPGAAAIPAQWNQWVAGGRERAPLDRMQSYVGGAFHNFGNQLGEAFQRHPAGAQAREQWNNYLAGDRDRAPGDYLAEWAQAQAVVGGAATKEYAIVAGQWMQQQAVQATQAAQQLATQYAETGCAPPGAPGTAPAAWAPWAAMLPAELNCAAPTPSMASSVRLPMPPSSMAVAATRTSFAAAPQVPAGVPASINSFVTTPVPASSPGSRQPTSAPRVRFAVPPMSTSAAGSYVALPTQVLGEAVPAAAAAATAATAASNAATGPNKGGKRKGKRSTPRKCPCACCP
eukprot:TRINITY_DN14463_c0_g1_i2.p1 TRINITY_DN14463_c0_g1~~TRINITY_DN14463_c0_g1_i2.p1  ORF type:complete len:324 (-),score=61.85 TRINITY_DN14463_c0_g1_i2:167-1054(-)